MCRGCFCSAPAAPKPSDPSPAPQRSRAPPAGGEGNRRSPQSGKVRHVQSGKVTESEFLNSALKYLGPGFKEVSPGRYVSADGMRQVRYGKHEACDPGHHGDFETYDKPASQGGKKPTGFFFLTAIFSMSVFSYEMMLHPL
jgi:hypothetical protein